MKSDQCKNIYSTIMWMISGERNSWTFEEIEFSLYSLKSLFPKTLFDWICMKFSKAVKNNKIKKPKIIVINFVTCIKARWLIKLDGC